MINPTKNTAAEEAAIIITLIISIINNISELLLSSVITVVGVNTVVEDPGLNAFVFSNF